MKNIIKTAICLIVISSILLYSSISLADSDNSLFTVVTMSNANNQRQAELKYTILPSTEDNRSNTTAVYELSIDPSLVINGIDFFLNGMVRYQMIFNVGGIPTGNWTVDTVNVSCNFTSTESYYSMQRAYLYNGIDCFTWFNNYWSGGNSNSYINIGILTIQITIHDLVGAYPPATIPINISRNVISSNYSTTSLAVDNEGKAILIKNCITEALSNSELDLVYDYLTLWKTTQDGYLADIQLSVDDVETWLSNINSAQATLQNKIDLIYTLEQTFPGYFNSMISLLQQIRDMNASDTAAESEMQNAEQQLSQAVNDMEVQKPNINNVVNAGDQYMDSNITGAQGDTFFWLHGTNIFVTILTMAVTIGILGFVIYGKSG